MVILLKVTSRGRPDRLKKAVSEAIRLAQNPSNIRIVYTFDRDDTMVMGHFMEELLKIHPRSEFNFGPSEGKIAAINRDVPEDGWDVLVNLSDDQVCIYKHWDVIILKYLTSKDLSLWFFDGGQPRINTQEIIGLDYYKRDNYIYHPGFKSFFCDNLSTGLAIKRNRMVKSNLVLFRHEHFATEGFSRLNDDLYRKNSKYWAEDEALWFKLKSEFGV